MSISVIIIRVDVWIAREDFIKFTRRESTKTHAKFCSGSLKGRDHSDDLDVNGKIVSEWMLGKQDGSGYGTSGRLL
jgi:hypothetical protein